MIETVVWPTNILLMFNKLGLILGPVVIFLSNREGTGEDAKGKSARIDCLNRSNWNIIRSGNVIPYTLIFLLDQIDLSLILCMYMNFSIIYIHLWQQSYLEKHFPRTISKIWSIGHDNEPFQFEHC